MSTTIFSRCWFGCSPDHKDVYSYNFPDDGRRLKLLGMRNSHPLLSLSTDNSSHIVYTVFLLETVQTALTGADVYYWFASGYGDLNRLAIPFASAIDVPIMESIVSAMVQFFYAYRVWILSNKSWPICSLICLVGRSQALFNHSSAASFLVVLHSQCSIGIDRRYSCSRFFLSRCSYSGSLSQTQAQTRFAAGDRSLQHIAIV